MAEWLFINQGEMRDKVCPKKKKRIKWPVTQIQNHCPAGDDRLASDFLFKGALLCCIGRWRTDFISCWVSRGTSWRKDELWIRGKVVRKNFSVKNKRLLIESILVTALGSHSCCAKKERMSEKRNNLLNCRAKYTPTFLQSTPLCSYLQPYVHDLFIWMIMSLTLHEKNCIHHWFFGWIVSLDFCLHDIDCSKQAPN